MTIVLFWSVVGLVFFFAMTNGFLDGGGIMSTVVTTRALNPLPALVLVASCEAAGLFVLGRAVAQTVGLRLVMFPAAASPERILSVLGCAIIAALLWNIVMWRLSLPTSSSHALIGGLLGSILMGFGFGAIRWSVAVKILVFLGVGPWLAAGVGFALSRIFRWSGQWTSPSVSGILRRLHAAVSGGLALAHGSMDGQKSLAVMWLALGAVESSFTSPPRALLPILCGSALALGVVLGSQRTLQTLGRDLYRVQPLQGFCAETAAMALVTASSLVGWPMATSHAMSSAVLGAGAAVRPKGIRWRVAAEIALAWMFTIPAAGMLSASLFWGVRKVLDVVS
jgi:inorganic phosphate transporter, PiT family